MAISIQSQRNDYSGNGSTTVFAYIFKILSASDLDVIVTDSSGNETELLYPSEYTVSGIGNTSGGNVTTATAVASGSTITIRRIRQLTQTTSFRNETEFYGSLHEDALRQAPHD
jgi:hypothetical protein